MLTIEGCKLRQQRLLREMDVRNWDLFVTADYRSVYYFTGLLVSADVPVLFASWKDGRTLLIAPENSEGVAAERLAVDSYSPARIIDYPENDLVQAWQAYLSGRTFSTVGSDLRVAPGALQFALGNRKVEDAARMLLEVRRRKEADEIEEIRWSLELCAVAYDAARRAIAPGQREVDVYAAMHTAVVKKAGTAVAFPGDFACGERCIRGGGPPTERLLQPGDLYILDIFPAPALYFGDVCRAYTVTEPTDLQRQAYEIVHQAVILAEQAVRPGVAVREVYQLAKDFLDSHKLTENSFWHHLGHGIGHRGHEAPRIIPGSDEVFAEGDVITLEPGVYSAALSGGIRLEDNYIVRSNGLENLFHYPRGIER